MKKIVFVFFALFLLMFSSCRTLSYTETEVIPSSDAYATQIIVFTVLQLKVLKAILIHFFLTKKLSTIH